MHCLLHLLRQFFSIFLALRSRLFRFFYLSRGFQSFRQHTSSHTAPQDVTTLLREGLARSSRLVSLFANDSTEELPRHDVENYAHELIVACGFSSLQGGLEGLLGSDDGRRHRTGRADQVVSGDDATIGRMSAVRSDLREKGTALVVVDVARIANDLENVEGTEEVELAF